MGTLLVVNPGASSCVNNGPINWQPAVAGYPALLVDSDNGTSADFAIYATNRMLSEKENGVNFNPTGAPHDEFGQDADTNDIYRSQIRGLIAIRHDLTFQNRSPVGARSSSATTSPTPVASWRSITSRTPCSIRRPVSGRIPIPRRTGSMQKAVLP